MAPKPPRPLHRPRHRTPRLHRLLTCQIRRTLLAITRIRILNRQSGGLNTRVDLRVDGLHDGELDACGYGCEAVVLHQDNGIIGFGLRGVWEGVV